MSLTSFWYFVFLLFLFSVYYSIGKNHQKEILLIASLFFYFCITGSINIFFLIAYESLVTYYGGLLIEKNRNRQMYTVISILAILIPLVILKYAYNLSDTVLKITGLTADISALNFPSIIGISYYSLSAIGYLTEVSWDNIKPEKRIIDVMLFVFYFPQLISGPVTRYAEMTDQFNEKHFLKYETVTKGIRRMIWGYFKKLVISERFRIVVRLIFRSYGNYSFIGIIFATLCYAVQLYTDFSGCMDIIMGTSEIFDVVLPENFNAPFLSNSLRDFWQRWHITLGTWFKDYVMYPIQISKPMISIQKMIRKRFGKQSGKKIPFYLSMIILWTLLGIWHGGTPYYFVASGVIPCVFLIFLDAFKVDKKNNNLQNENFFILFFRSFRTILIVCVCWFVVCCGSLHKTLEVSVHAIYTITDFANYVIIPKDVSLEDWFFMMFGLIILFYVEYKQYRNIIIFDLNDKYGAKKNIIIICELLIIMFFGKIETSSFIYFKF